MTRWQAAASMPPALLDGRDVLLWANGPFIACWTGDRWLTTEQDEIDGGAFCLGGTDVRFFMEMTPPGPLPSSEDQR